MIPRASDAGGLLPLLSDEAVWAAFLQEKRERGTMTASEERELTDLAEGRAYLPVTERIAAGACFGIPRRVEVNKSGTGKKRIVYSFPPAENGVLRLLSWLLHRYDGLFAPNLYSFRRHRGVRHAIRHLTALPEGERRWAYKVDIHNYFNSVPLDRLFPLLEEALSDDPALVRFLEKLLSEPRVRSGGDIVCEETKGIMAGIPVSSFLANLYLSELDWRFYRARIPYARYSDDIIVFAPTEGELEERIRLIRGFLDRAGLTVNPEKEVRFAPGEGWTFLGIRCQGSRVDLSPVSMDKLKAKLRRKARALVRWRARKGLDGSKAVVGYIRYLNRKLYDNPARGELTWCRWYFPLINTADSLRELDRYMVRCIRYVATGRHNKGNYALTYDEIRRLGFRSLVHAYYGGLTQEPEGGSEPTKKK